MKAPLLLSSAALLLSVWALVAAWTTSRTSAPALETEVFPHQGVDLSVELRDMRERLHALESRALPAPSQRTPLLDGAATGFVTRAELDALRAELQDALKNSGRALDTPEFEGQVAEAVQTLRRNEAYTRAEAGLEKRASQVEARVNMYSKWLGLDDYQQQQVAGFLRVQDELQRQVLQAWESGADDMTLKELQSAGNAEFLDSMRSVLTPEQAATVSAKYGDGSKNY